MLLSYTVLSSSLEVDKQAASEKKQLEGGLRTSDTTECMKNSRGINEHHNFYQLVNHSYVAMFLLGLRIASLLEVKCKIFNLIKFRTLSIGFK